MAPADLLRFRSVQCEHGGLDAIATLARLSPVFHRRWEHPNLTAYRYTTGSIWSVGQALDSLKDML